MGRERSIQVCDFQVRFLEHAKNLFLARNRKEINPPIDLLWTVTNTLWQLLADDGSMFIEYPYGYYTDVFYWINRAAKKCSLEFSSDDKSIAVRIDKKESKLKQFPFI